MNRRVSLRITTDIPPSRGRSARPRCRSRSICHHLELEVRSRTSIGRRVRRRRMDPLGNPRSSGRYAPYVCERWRQGRSAPRRHGRRLRAKSGSAAAHATRQISSRRRARITIGPAAVMITTMQLVMEQLQREHTAPVSTSSIALNSACRHEIVQFARL